MVAAGCCAVLRARAGWLAYLLLGLPIVSLAYSYWGYYWGPALRGHALRALGAAACCLPLLTTEVTARFYPWVTLRLYLGLLLGLYLLLPFAFPVALPPACPPVVPRFRSIPLYVAIR